MVAHVSATQLLSAHQGIWQLESRSEISGFYGGAIWLKAGKRTVVTEGIKQMRFALHLSGGRLPHLED